MEEDFKRLDNYSRIQLLHLIVQMEIISGASEKDEATRKRKAEELAAYIRENTVSDKEARFLMSTVNATLDNAFGG